MSIPTVDLKTLVSDLASYLAISEVADYGPNGLQVEGNPEIAKLVTGVSACHQLFVRARETGADAILVHHGIFWDGMPYPLTGIQYRRVRQLIDGDMSLLAYHLPLDRHLEVGNNAVAARRLGLVDIQPFGLSKGVAIGVRGTLPEPLAFSNLLEKLGELYGQVPLGFARDPAEPVSTVGIISGGAQKELHQAIDAGLDVFITGEASEWVMNLSLESGTRFVSAGHYATERFGVQVLGEYIERRYGIEVEFIDVPNPV
jgi:dinuclear metal center YbgI/SA1388 family protein